MPDWQPGCGRFRKSLKLPEQDLVRGDARSAMLPLYNKLEQIDAGEKLLGSLAHPLRLQLVLLIDRAENMDAAELSMLLNENRMLIHQQLGILKKTAIVEEDCLTRNVHLNYPLLLRISRVLSQYLKSN